jgi:hypothetical protein
MRAIDISCARLEQLWHGNFQTTNTVAVLSNLISSPFWHFDRILLSRRVGVTERLFLVSPSIAGFSFLFHYHFINPLAE